MAGEWVEAGFVKSGTERKAMHQVIWMHKKESFHQMHLERNMHKSFSVNVCSNYVFLMKCNRMGVK